MSEKFKVKVDNSNEFDISRKEISELDAVASNSGNYHVLKGNKSYKAQVVDSNFLKKTYDVKVGSNVYSIKIADQLDQLISEMGFSIGTSKQVNSIKAPMPGLILDVMVEEGQTVKEDDALLILEAMKMENVLVSQREGVIKTVTVKKGEAVDKNHLLIEFE